MVAIAVGLGALLLQAAAAWHPTPHSKAPNATAGEELFERAVAAVRGCAARDDAYLSCALGSEAGAWDFYFHRFGSAQITNPTGRGGQLTLVEGFDVLHCAGAHAPGRRIRRACPLAPRGFNDTEAVLLTHPWGGNFQHYVFELLPRAWLAAELLRRARPDEAEPAFVVHLRKHQRTGFFADAARLAVGTEIELAADQEGRRGFRNVWVPPYVADNFRAWSNLGLKALRHMHAKAQETYVTRPPRPGTIVYFTRRDASAGKGRALVNEAELIAALAGRGARILDFSAFPTLGDRVRGLANYSVVVTPFGAGFANLVFAHPGARWLGVCPPTMCNSHERFFLDQLTSALGFRTGVQYTVATAARAVNDGGGGAGDPANVPYSVDVPAVVRVVEGLARS